MPDTDIQQLEINNTQIKRVTEFIFFRDNDKWICELGITLRENC